MLLRTSKTWNERSWRRCSAGNKSLHSKEEVSQLVKPKSEQGRLDKIIFPHQLSQDVLVIDEVELRLFVFSRLLNSVVDPNFDF
jgi:hypothetical protein